MHEFTVSTERRTQVIDITGRVQEALAGSEGAAALVYVPHTTAAVTINEHADPALKADLERGFERVVGDDWEWNHEDEDGPNAPSHMRSSLTGPSVLIPLVDGKLALGTWQGIFLCEFDGPRDRRVLVTTLR